MKIIYLLPFSLLVVFSCASKKQANLVFITVTDSVINTMQGGFGASMHAIEDSLPVSTDNGKYRSWGGSAWGGNPVAEDTAAWRQIFRHADWLGLDWCRVEMEHRMYEPDKGKFTFDNKEMRIMYRWLDYCQSHNVDVYFSEMWPNTKWLAYKNSIGDRVAELTSAPRDIDAWASGYVTLLSYLIKERKYTCIKWIAIVNEPMASWGWWRQANGEPQDIYGGLMAMKEKIDAAKLPVKLVATDGEFKYKTEAVEKYLPLIGAISLHDYNATFDWWKSNPHIDEDVNAIRRFKKLGRNNGNLPVFAAEFGTTIYGFSKDTAAPSLWNSMLHDVQLMIRMCNAGIDGMNRWSFTNRGDLDGQWQLIDTWDTATHSIRKEITPHNNSYYGIGFLSRFTTKYSEVLQTIVNGGKDTIVFERADHSKDTVHRVFATTFKKGDNYSVYITNDSDNKYPLKLSFSGAEKNLTLYLYEINERDHKGKTNLKIEPLAEYHINKGNGIDGTIEPKSLMVYTTYKLGANDKGIVKE